MARNLWVELLIFSNNERKVFFSKMGISFLLGTIGMVSVMMKMSPKMDDPSLLLGLENLLRTARLVDGTHSLFLSTMRKTQITIPVYVRIFCVVLIIIFYFISLGRFFIATSLMIKIIRLR